MLAKLKILESDPAPDGKAKKKLKYMGDDLYRLRCGDYRIFYTYHDPYISLLQLDRRADDTYDGAIEAVDLGGYVPVIELPAPQKPERARERPALLAPATGQSELLPEPITGELLLNLRIPAEYHAHLLALRSEDELIGCSDVPQTYLEMLLDYLYPPALSEVMQQPRYLLDDLDDLIRYKEGELLGFLLKLSPEQERFVSWAMRATGPTQVKGGPGTGKSTVALYRVRSLIEKLRKQNVAEPRILFTTYTNALIHFSEQLLAQLLGEDARFVEVQTADKKMSDILKRAGAPKKTPNEQNHDLLRTLLIRAIKQAPFEGNLLQQQAQGQAIERLGYAYVQEEIHQVLMARQIATFADYLTARRPGRKIRLNELQKKAVWCVYQAYLERLKKISVETWEQARVRAEQLVVHDVDYQGYDAVVVDEAQDLDPASLRMLLALCKAPNRFFITADANQSIYGSGFNWSDVHESLKFQGRTSVLKANYRSTREIGEAAQSYLSTGVLDDEPVERKYMHNGPFPVLGEVYGKEEEMELLMRFLRGAARSLRFGLGSCAVLCPSNECGRTLANSLRTHGIEATFMEGKHFKLSSPGVKVLTLNSAKGLEFPIVALAGFAGSYYAGIAASSEKEEELARLRRTIFVGMTRAMRALLVVVPAGTPSPLLTGFDSRYWHMTSVADLVK